jgi:hypothetical protein
MTDTSCASTDKTDALPFFTVLFGSFGLIVDKFRYFVQMGLPFALFLGLFYIICGQDAACLLKSGPYCSKSFTFFVLTRAIVLFLMCMFMRNWYLVALKGQDLSPKQILLPRLADVKILFLVLANMISWLIAGGAFYLLSVRVPNPDWRIELAYFAVVSVFFLAPVLATRFLSWIAFAAEDAPLPSPATILKKTAGRSVLLFVSLVVILLVSLFIQQSILQKVLLQSSLAFYQLVFSEWFIETIAVLIVCMFMNYCALQKHFFFEDKK